MRFVVGSALFVFFFLASHRSATCQDLNRAHMAPKTVANPTNSWQQEARESKPIPTSQDAQKVRAARDAYADKIFGVGFPIEQLLEKNWGYSNPSPRLPTGIEGILPPFPDETVVLGTFDSFDVILTTSRGRSTARYTLV